MSKKILKLTIIHPCCITPLSIYLNVTKNVAILWYLHMITDFPYTHTFVYHYRLF